MPIYYADSSALVKLIRAEPESEALLAFIGEADVVTCELALVEIPRAIRRAAAYEPALAAEALLERCGDLFAAIAMRPLDRSLLLAAGALAEPALRALDAIHVAAAADLHPLDGFATYDERQAAAARLAGLRTIAPGT